jgi:hypothetical protein
MVLINILGSNVIFCVIKCVVRGALLLLCHRPPHSLPFKKYFLTNLVICLSLILLHLPRKLPIDCGQLSRFTSMQNMYSFWLFKKYNFCLECQSLKLAIHFCMPFKWFSIIWWTYLGCVSAVSFGSNADMYFLH